MNNRTLFLLVSAISMVCSIVTPCAYATDGAADVARAKEAKQKYEKLINQLSGLYKNSTQIIEQENLAQEKHNNAAEKHRKAVAVLESSTDQEKATAEAEERKAYQELQKAEQELASCEAKLRELAKAKEGSNAQITLLQEEELSAMKKAAEAGHPEAKAFMERESVAEAAVRHDRESASKEGKTRSEHDLSLIRHTAQTNYDTAVKAGKKATKAYVKAVLEGTHPHLALYKAVPDKSILSKNQQSEGSYHQGQELITKTYKNIGPDFFYKDTDTSSTESVIFNMKGLGLTFPKGASASYNKKAKTLEMTNTKAEHDNMKKVMKIYRGEIARQEQADSRGVTALQALKFTSGKPNWDADIFVLVCISQLTLNDMFDDNSPKEWEALFKKEGVIKHLQKIQKKKGVTTLYIVEQGADMKLARQYAKILKLKAPIAQAANIKLYNDTVPADGISIHDRTGKCRYQGLVDGEIGNALTTIEELQKTAEQE